MSLYQVTVTETRTMSRTIEAGSSKEAADKIDALIDAEEIQLNIENSQILLRIEASPKK